MISPSVLWGVCFGLLVALWCYRAARTRSRIDLAFAIAGLALVVWWVVADL